MSDDTIRLLFLGDVVGEAGVIAVEKALPSLFQTHSVDFCVVNGENMHEGRGINEGQAKRLLKAGADVLTGGDHSFDKHLIFPFMAKEPRLLRPANYPHGAPGQGMGVYELPSKGLKVGVLNLRGNAFFHNPIFCPFRAADRHIKELKEQTDLIFLDFHAEATGEKRAMAWHLHDRIPAMCGTHTHVQTADAEIFPGGMGYLSDAGFCGGYQGVIGMSKEVALKRHLLQTPQKYEGAPEDDLRVHGVLYEIDTEAAFCRDITRIVQRLK